jgi:hypothetical protein
MMATGSRPSLGYKTSSAVEASLSSAFGELGTSPCRQRSSRPRRRDGSAALARPPDPRLAKASATDATRRRHQSTRAGCRVAVSRRNHRHILDRESPTGSDHRQLGRPGHRPRSPHLDGQDHRHRPPRRRRADGVSHGASDAGQPCPPGAAITRDPSRGSHLRRRRADPVRTPIPARLEALVAEAQKLRTVQPAVGTDESTTPQPGRPESQQAESSTCHYDSPRTERHP